MTVCIDSQIIIWGIKEQSTPGQEEMIGKAQSFFKWIDEGKHDCIIPSIVVAEVLAPEPPEIRAAYLDILNQGFVIVNFDIRAAMKYADLLNGRFSEVKQKSQEMNIDKHTMKADHMIIATAMANGANCIFSYDRGMKAFSNGLIDVREFPVYTVQSTLFNSSQDSPF
jgi:predicted nucleic acid-binding protein